MTVEEYAKTYLENDIRTIENSYRKDVLTELTIFEKAIIYKYTEDGFDDLNEKLRISKGENITLFGTLLSGCLGKLPDFDEIAYRGVNLSSIEFQLYINAFENSEIITEHFFISSSSSIYVGNSYGETLFKIFSQKGKKIEMISKYPNEKEVIFRYGSKFRVFAVEGNYISLIEV
ncbi:MAG: ADP-ribosyltransferase [Emticicia sp.]|nr:ADP-ribosyltransferase [Emticicia sp.]